ncbi:hypothetical protein GCM10028826_32710 [Mucilaginibacter boryungensis]
MNNYLRGIKTDIMIKNCPLLSAICLLFILFSGKSFGQTSPDSLLHQRAQTVFLEAGGAGVVFSANYDTRFSKKRNGWGGRIGIGYFHDRPGSIVLLPIQVNYLFGKTKNFFELGAGITAGSVDDKTDVPFGDDGKTVNGAVATLTAAFRHQALGRGIYYKISFDGIFDTENLHNVFPYIGAGLGYTFR